MVRKLPERKRAAPAYFEEDFSPKKQKSPTKPTSSSQYVFLAVKTEDDPDSFYLARASRYNFEKGGEFTVRWLVKLAPQGGTYKVDFHNDKIHEKMVIGEVELTQVGSSKYRLSAQERKRILSDNDEESETSESESEEEEKPAKKEPKKRKAGSAKKGPEKGKKPAAKRAKKEKKEKEKKPKKLAKNYVVPNEELVANSKVKLFPDGEDGFLVSASTNFVSGLVASKVLIRAVMRGDAKMVQQLVNDPSKCPCLRVPRSVDMQIDALTLALAKGNVPIIKILAKELHSQKPKKRPTLETPLLSTVSSGTYNFRSLGVPVIRDVMMSRGGREGLNALTQDDGDYNPGEPSDFVFTILRDNIPLETVSALEKAIEDATGNAPKVKFGRRWRNSGDGEESILSDLVQKIDYVMIFGHWKLAGRLVELSKTRGMDTFNYLHVAALTKTDLSTVGPIRAASVTKKTMRNMNISPLHCAAINPNPQFLEELLRVSPDYNITDKRGRRPIHFAAACQTSGPLKVLLSAGVPYFEPDSTGGTPLTYASIVGRTENVKLLLEQAKKDQNGTGQEDISQASQAVISKYGPCAINKTARDGKGALHHAAANNHLEICKLLVENGANVDMASGSEKRTALMMAATFGNLNIVKYLVEHGKALVERRDGKLRTALIFAVKNGHAHVTAYLLRLGADPNTADSSGNRAVHYASAYGWLDCLNLLIAAGADCNVENDWNMRPVVVSFLKGHIGITRELLKQPGADVNFGDRDGRTLVMLTCQARVSEPLFNQLNFLVTQMKADAKLVDIYGCNALHFLACAADGPEDVCPNPKELRNRMAKLLLDAGCSAAHENAMNRTPVNAALENQRAEFVELLLNRGGVICQKPFPGTLQNSFHIMANGCMGLDYSKILDQLKLRVSRTVIDEMVKAKDSQNFTPLMTAAKAYWNQCPPYKKGTKEFDEWAKRGLDFIRRLVEDFGADVKEIAPTLPKKKKIHSDDSEESSDEESSDQSSSNDQDEDGSEEDTSEESGEKIVVNKEFSTLVHYLLLPTNAPPALELVRKFRPPLDIYNSNGETPAISVAAQGSNVEAMRVLVECGANLNLATCEPGAQVGVTPLLMAGLKGRIEVVIYLVYLENVEAAKIDLKATIPSTGDSISSLLCAIECGNVDQRLNCLQLLAKKTDFDLNFNNKKGRSLIMLAIGTNKRQVDSSNAIEQFLVGKGADCYEKQDDQGRTALHWLFLSTTGTDGAAKMIDESLDPVDLLSLVVGSIPQASSIDMKDAFDRTPLHYAAACGATICCLRLLARGANIDTPDKNGDTPLSLAVRYNRKSVVLVLFQSKPNLNITVEYAPVEFVPVEPTKKPKKCELIEWRNSKLAKAGCKIGHPSKVDLFSAVIRLQWQGLTSLLIDILTEKDKTVLFTLIGNCLTSATYNLASTLLNRAKDKQELRDLIKTRTGAGDRGLFALLALGATKSSLSNSQLVLKVANQIAEFGCDATAKDAFGCTPLHYACLNQYKPLVEYFSPKPKSFVADKFGRWPIHALFWNLTDYDAFKRIMEILPIITNVNGGIDSAVDFAPLEYSIPPCSHEFEYSRSDYFVHYDVQGIPATTCLIRCVQSSYYLLTAAILKAGASPHSKGSNGLTPIMAAILANSVECFLVLLSEGTEKEALEESNKQTTMRLNDRVILNFLKPSIECGLNLTPKELQTCIKNAKQAPDTSPVASVPTFGSGTLFAPEQEPVEEDKDEDESESDDEEAIEIELPVAKKSSDRNLKPGEKLPFLIPFDSKKIAWTIGQTVRSCAIDYSVLRQIEAPKNARKIDLMAIETVSGNNAFHLAMSSPYRNTLEARFFAFCLTEMEKRLALAKNHAGQTPQQLSESLEHKMIRSQSSALRASKAVDLDKISEDWMAEMEKLADQKRKQDVPDPNKELIPDKRFASYSTSKLVRDPESQRLFNALMTKIDLHNGGWTEFNFYQLQLIRMTNTGLYVVFTRWGRIGSEGMYQQTPFKVFKDAETEFCKIFKQKSGNDWRKFLTNGFTVIPKRYRLVTLDRPDRFGQLTSVKIDLKISDKTTSLPKPEFDVVKSIVETSLNSINDGTIFQRLSQIHLTPFGLLSQQSLKDAHRLLNELKEIVGKVENRHGIAAEKLSQDQIFALYEKIGHLSEEYYHIVPRSGFAYCEVYPLADTNSVQNEMKKIDILLNFQASTRLLLAAEQNKAKENPCDFVLSCLGMTIRPVDPETKEAQDILRYATATWSPKENGGVEAIYKLDRPKEVDQQAALKLGNRRLLWHGTKLQNLLGIFSTGLQASPEGVQHAGQIFGDGVYLSDAFAKSVMYCDSVQGEASFMLLCDVALGTCAYTEEEPATLTERRAANTLISWTNKQPDSRFSVVTSENVTLPYGGLAHIGGGNTVNHGYHSNSGHDEFIVKNSKQIVLKYLIKFWQR